MEEVELPEFEDQFWVLKNSFTEIKYSFLTMRWLTKMKIGITEDLGVECTEFPLKCGTKLWTSTNTTTKETLKCDPETRVRF
jgi:hypothetical protein